MYKLGETQILRFHWENWWWEWNKVPDRVFWVIEWGNPGRVDFRQFRIDMIRNEIPQFNLSDFSFHWFYDRRNQFWWDDIEYKSSLSKEMDEYGMYIYWELYDLKEKIESQFMSFFSQEHTSYNTIEDLYMWG